MDLSEFVRQTINSVVSGVVLSQDDLKKTNIIISHLTYNLPTHFIIISQNKSCFKLLNVGL